MGNVDMEQAYPMGKRGYLGYIMAPVLALSVLSMFTSGSARDIDVKTGLGIGYEWYERKYDRDDLTADNSQDGGVTTTEDLSQSLDDKYNRFRVMPQINIESLTVRDQVRVHYVPSFLYDTDTYETDIFHDLTASFTRYVTENWRFSLDERFILSDVVKEDYTDQTTTADNELTDNDGRRTYMNNNISLVSQYSYLEDSVFSLGYANTILENIDDDVGLNNYENYIRHTFLMSAHHRFNSRWKLLFDSEYVRGLYDEIQLDNDAVEEPVSNDLEEFRISATFEANFIEYHPLSLSYSLYNVEYDEEIRKGNSIQNFALGYQWNYSKHFLVSLSGGPSFIKTDEQDGEWGYNADLAVQYIFNNGNLRLSGLRGYDRQNFSGTNENGLQEFWEARFDFTYNPWEDVNVLFYGSYRYRDQEYLTDVVVSPDDETDFELTVYNRQTTRAGAKLNYLFRRWYIFSLAYDFTHQESEQPIDSYDEHRFVVTLSYEQDVFKW